MKSLNDIVPAIEYLEIFGSTDREISGISLDSRKIENRFLFAAIKGAEFDGHQFIEKAIEKGAKCIVCDDLPKQLKSEICYIRVENVPEILGKICAAFYDYPTHGFELIGITGTNGKTTVATLLYKLFKAMGHKVGLISTVENIIDGEIIPAQLTTPDVVSLNQLLFEMNAKGCDYVFMEASSHAIHQRRIAGLKFAGGVFTNISHDHLDYHKTFKSYIQAKKKFFDDLDKDAFAITNIDDRNGSVMIQNSKAIKRSFSLRKMAEYKGRVLSNSIEGLHLEMNGIEVHLKLVGDFNAYNALAVYGVACELGFDHMEVLRILSELDSAEGRFAKIISREKGISAIIDYAHTPDALEKVLETIDGLRVKDTRIISVVGCGGNRDKRKRPRMAKVASEKSDVAILTSDNPRDENPGEIIAEMLKGVPPNRVNYCLQIEDRKSAIISALSLAKRGDIILIAGKGHEKYQEIKGIKIPFNDKEIVQEFLQKNI